MPVLLLAAYATGIAMVRFIAPWNLAGLSVTAAFLLFAWASVRHSRWATLVSLGEFHYLVDGGGLPGSRIDPGERLVAPALG